MEVALQTLQSAGLSDDDTVDAYKSFGGYIMGFVLMETRQMFRPPEGAAPESVAEQLPDELPNLKRLFPVLCASDVQLDFDFGIELMIAGLREHVRGKGPAGKPDKRSKR